MFTLYSDFCICGGSNSIRRQASNHPTRERLQSIMAAATARSNTADAWRAEAGLQLLQLSVVHVLKLSVQPVFMVSHLLAPVLVERQPLAEMPDWPATVTLQEKQVSAVVPKSVDTHDETPPPLPPTLHLRA